jgi:hypothetical protein
MTIFDFIGFFFSQNDVFKLQEVFSELGIREQTWKFSAISYFTDLRFDQLRMSSLKGLQKHKFLGFFH